MPSICHPQQGDRRGMGEVVMLLVRREGRSMEENKQGHLISVDSGESFDWQYEWCECRYVTMSLGGVWFMGAWRKEV